MAEKLEHVFLDDGTSPELAIRQAILEVQAVGAHPRLARAARLLSLAHREVATCMAGRLRLG
jgi:hypothetical protein